MQRLERQPPCGFLLAFSDSDFVGCLKARRSTPCAMLFHCKHFLNMICATQVPNALSSGESEWYALTHAASALLSMKHLARDLGRNLEAKLAGDMNVAAGIGARRGVGRIRHLEARSLWLQKHITEQYIVVSRQKGVDNPADLGTKHLDRPTVETPMQFANFEPGAGRLSLRAAV